MALVPGYKYDIFISYAHRDNQPLLFGQKGWKEENRVPGAVATWLILPPLQTASSLLLAVLYRLQVMMTQTMTLTG